MVEFVTTEDSFLVQHTDFSLREQVNYPNGGNSRFYDNGIDMVIIDENICTHNSEEPIFHICLSLISRIITCINLEEYLGF